VLLDEWLTVFGHLPIEGTTDRPTPSGD